MSIEDIANVRSKQTQELFPLQTRSSGSSPFRIQMSSETGSILSSVFIKSGDPGATLKVDYFQTTTDDSSQTAGSSENSPLTSHRLMTVGPDTGVTDKILITRIHNKPECVVTVLGGTIEFGVYLTGTDESASDIDSALQLDGATFSASATKGLPFMCYDEAQGKIFIMRCDGGTIPVSFSEAGDAKFLDVLDETITPGVEQTLGVHTVPSGKTFKLTTVQVSSFQPGRWTLTESEGGSIIGTGRTGPGNSESVKLYTPRREIVAGGSDIDLTLKFKATASSAAGCIDAILMGSEL